MKKGQIKLLEKAKKYGFCEEALVVLQSENLTLDELDTRFWLLYRQNGNDAEKKQAVEKLNEMLSFNDENRPFVQFKYYFSGLCNRIRWEYILDTLEQWKNGNISEGKVSGKIGLGEYIDLLQELSRIDPPLAFSEFKYITNEYLFDETLSKYREIYCTSYVLRLILESRKDHPELSVDDLFEIARIAAESGCINKWDETWRGNIGEKVLNFVKRVLNWRRAEKTDEDIIEMQKAINNGEYDSLCKRDIEKSYPGLFDILDKMKKDEENKRQNIKVNHLKENEILFFQDSEDFIPYFDFCRSLPWKEKTRIHPYDCQITDDQSLFSTSTGGIIFSYNVSLTGISFSIQPIKKVLFSKRRTWQQKDGKMVTGTLKEDIILNVNRNTNIKEYFFSNDYWILKKIYRRGWVPVSLIQLSQIYEKYQKSFGRIVRSYIDIQIKNGHYAWKDVQRYFSGTCAYPEMAPKITVEDLQKAHSYDEAVKSHYKSADFVNWGKVDPSMAYMIMKNINKVEENSKKELLRRKYDAIDTLKDLNTNSLDVNTFFAAIIYDNLKNKDTYPYEQDSLKMLIMDYIRNSQRLHKKIKLTFQSWKKVEEAHDDIGLECTMKRTPVIKIPAKSKFAKLRKMLPDSYEWIKTRKRIVEEGYTQHHCVATYADDVNKDRCAIYSMIDEESPERNRYTIEIRFSSKLGRYYIKQIQGKFNSGCPKYIKKNLEELLRNK